MKISIYFDVYVWTRQASEIYPTCSPNLPKIRGAIRYRVDVEIPDPAEPDRVIKGEAIEVKEDSEP